MMVVIGIIGILSMIAIPNIISWLPKHRLGSAARSLLSTMQYARLTAVKRNVNILVNFDRTADNYTVFPDLNSSNDQDSNEPTLKQGQMPAGVSITGTDFTNDILRFDSRGLVTGMGTIGGTISIENNLNDETRIRINRTGNSRILADDLE